LVGYSTAILEKAGLMAFSKSFSLNFDETYEAFSKSGGVSDSSYAREFFVLGAADFAIVSSALGRYPRFRPPFFSLPFHVTGRDLIFSILKGDTVVMCERWGYPLARFSADDRKYKLRTVLDNFILFAGDISKFDLYQDMAPQAPLAMSANDAISFFENLRRRMKNHGRMPPRLISPLSLLVSCEVPVWKLGFEVAIRGPQHLEGKSSEFAKAIQSYSKGLREIAERESLIGYRWY